MFKILHRSKISKARYGQLKIKNGTLETPFFMPDATRGVLKNISRTEMIELGMEAMVVNTFHALLTPGLDIIKKNKGINNFMNWPGPLLSDSGGFQVFSLIHKNSQMGKIYEDKVVFKSPLDGAKHELTPERSIQIQFELGVDMIVVLDDCPPHDHSQSKITKSVDRTIAWAKRCKAEYSKQVKKRKLKIKPLIFGVIQGGLDNELRKKCGEALVDIGFDGYGFGARPVDSHGNFIGDVLEYTADLVPENNLRFGLGIGTPEDIIRCVNLGWDMFDCVIPTREGRHGKLFIKKCQDISSTKYYETINISNAKFALDKEPINKKSRLADLRDYSRGYLHHLFKISDPLGARLASLNNLEFYLELMRNIRINIKKGRM